nr:nuclear pore complex protein Nup133 [Onthophagus taurus]
MERSFGASFLSSRSPFSPKTRPIDSRRSGFRKSSRLSVSGKSQSINQILLRSQNYFVESYGQSLPVLITEALTFSERTTPVSANLSDNGYVWLVCGRRVLIWQYRQAVHHGTPQRKTATNQCIELKLPQSDLAHKAELVSVFIAPNSNVASCIASSPEGVVRYWPSIAHEGVSIEECVDLQGQECDSLIETNGFGCVLVTTTCTTVILQPQNNSGRHQLICKILKMPSGWLGGIGKRMSSLIFGPISSEQTAEARTVRVLKVEINERSRFVFVLTGHTLHKWKLNLDEPEQYLFALDLNILITGECFGNLLDNYNKNQSNAEISIIDIQANKKYVVLLVAGAQTNISPQVHYALIYIDLYAQTPPGDVSKVSILKMTGTYRESNPTDHLLYRLILIDSSIYIYNKRHVLVVNSMDELDVLEFSSPHDYLLCGNICVNVPIFFTRNHGLVSICSNDRDTTNLNITTQSYSALNETAQNDSNTAGNLTLFNIDPTEMLQTFKDITGQLKTAFIYHVQNQQMAAKEILDEIFNYDRMSSNNYTMDQQIVEVCIAMLNDCPTGDPRWHNENVASGLGSSYSMQIIIQLEDKQKALTLYYKFLREMDIWNRLSYVVERESNICTTYVLGEYLEKVITAFILKSYPTNEILEKAVERAVRNIEIDAENGLTAQDIFYKDVTKVYKGLQEIVFYCEDIVNSVMNPTEIGNIIVKSNEIILTVLDQVLFQRQSNALQFTPNDEILRENPEYIPWTVASGPEGLYDALITQQSLTYNYGIKNTSASSLHNTMYDQLVYLIDIILDGRKNHLQSVKGTEKEQILLKHYEKDRHALIYPFVVERQWDRAALLAEKYLDFETMVTICERTKNERRLDDYIDRFTDEGFPQFLLTWYVQENKQAELINKCKSLRDGKHSKVLSNFLTDHPSLSWIQLINNEDFSKAGDVLQHLAMQENESLLRQKTMLSLSKLSKLASTNDFEDSVMNINSALELIELQEGIPDYVLQQFGYDTLKPCVISPIKLIHLYTCPEYNDATELEFKKALDILPYVDQEVFEECKLEIWKRAILRDSWNEKSLESPLEILQNKLFFKLGDFTTMLGSDLNSVLPPIDVLCEDDGLQLLQKQKSFQFLLKMAYEQFSQM